MFRPPMVGIAGKQTRRASQFPARTSTELSLTLPAEGLLRGLQSHEGRKHSNKKEKPYANSSKSKT